MRNLGRAVKARFGYQADALTVASSGWVVFPFYSIIPPADPDFVDDPHLGETLENTRDPIAPLRALVAGQLRMTVRADLNMLGHWLKFLLGTLTTTGTSPNFVHTAKSGRETQPYATIQVAWQSGDVGQYRNCRLNTMAFDFTKDPSYLRVDMTWEVGAFDYDTTFLSGTTATALTAAPLLKYKSTASWGGTLMADLLQGTLNFTNNLDRYNTMSGEEFPAEMDQGLLAITGTLRLRHKDRTFRQLSKTNAAPAALSINTPSLSDATNRLFNLAMANVRLKAEGPQVNGPGGVEESFSIRPEQTASVEALLATLKCGTAGTVYA